MKNLYGIWLDHKSAFVLKANLMGEFTEVTKLESDIEGHDKTQLYGGEHFTIVNQHKGDNRHGSQMKHFTDKIIAKIADADEILVFGPAEAKFEFKHALEAHKALASKLKAVDSADHMSEAEMKAFVKKSLMLPRD